MSDKITSLKLNTKDKRKYQILNTFAIGIILILVIFIIYKVIFPSQYFTYSFKNVNSLKNTITDVSLDNQGLSFFASTPFKFSQLQLNITLEKNNSSIQNKTIEIQKSYKAFFYPQGEALNNLSEKQENILSSLDDSVFIVGNNKKTPIDSTETFEALGYSWANVTENKEDLSNFEKQKLADINAPHPDGTIFKTIENSELYFIDNKNKRELDKNQLGSIKNPILVNEKSLASKEICSLKKTTLSNNKYTCTVKIYELNNLLGKDYKFNLQELSDDLKINKIDIEFKKSSSLENFDLFLFELKKKVLYRFGIKNF